MTPMQYLDQLSDKVINNRYNDDGMFYLRSYLEVINAFKECNLLTQVELEKVAELYKQLISLYEDLCED
ncbi:hypothetical protein ABEF86_07910 [Acinetobacter thermotolerans]|uniref:hypothetical protein n=1 Tax=Acinetobacter thermotolerans TaxID=3151487 RepID=UPI00325B6F7B